MGGYPSRYGEIYDLRDYYGLNSGRDARESDQCTDTAPLTPESSPEPTPKPSPEESNSAPSTPPEGTCDGDLNIHHHGRAPAISTRQSACHLEPPPRGNAIQRTPACKYRSIMLVCKTTDPDRVIVVLGKTGFGFIFLRT